MDGVSATPPAGAHQMNARIEAERAGLPFLVYNDGHDRQRLFTFQPGSASASVGRQPSSDLLIDWDGQVSRLHARFEQVDGHWLLVDDGLSSNGTFVNGERLNGRCRLNDGDTLRFGTTSMTFRAPQKEVQEGQAGAQQGQAGRPEAAGDVDLSTTQRRVLVALCRPYKDRSGFASPATNQQIADELFLSANAVGTHLAVLCAKFSVEDLRPDEKRVRLVERAFSSGVISERDL
jgi:hypothetical protein